MSRRILATDEWLHIPAYEPAGQPGSEISANVRELPANGVGLILALTDQFDPASAPRTLLRWNTRVRATMLAPSYTPPTRCSTVNPANAIAAAAGIVITDAQGISAAIPHR